MGKGGEDCQDGERATGHPWQGLLGKIYIRYIWTYRYITRGSNGLTHSSDWRCAGWAATAPGNNPSRPRLWINIGTASLGRAVRGSRWSMKGEKMPCAKS
jgi:hypothetical protein